MRPFGEAMRRDQEKFVRITAAIIAITCLFIVIFLTYISINPRQVHVELLPEEIHPLRGEAYAAVLPRSRLWPFWTNNGDTHLEVRSGLVLYEDGETLRHPRSRQSDIEEEGGGRYLHLRETELYFATSDNSDPRANGRTYLAVIERIPAPGLPALFLPLGAAATTLAFLGLRCRPWPVPKTLCSQLPVSWLWIAAFAMLSVFWLRSVLYPEPMLVPSGDGGNVSALIAAISLPSRFTEDLVFSTPESLGFYITLVRPLVRALMFFTGDMGQAYTGMALPLLFLQMCGFFWLGRTLFGGAFWPGVLALISVPPVFVFGGELWGFLEAPLVRNMFGAFLPFLLLAALPPHGRSTPFVVMALCGFGIYLHPVSAPGMAAALWLAFALSPSHGTRLPGHALNMIAAGVVFLVFAIPFALQFADGAANIADPDVAGEFSAAVELIRGAIGSQYYDVRVALEMMIGGGVNNPRADWGWQWVLWLVAIAFLARRSFGRGFSPCARFMSFVLIGVLLGSAGVAALDQSVARVLGREPVQIDLVRNLRFVVPLLLIAFVWALSEHLGRPAKAGWRRHVAIFAGVALVLGWWYLYPTPVSQALALTNGHPAVRILSEASRVDARTALAFLSEKSQDSLVLPLPAGRDDRMGLAVRYGAFQPVAYLLKDMNFLLYGDGDRLGDWIARREQLAVIEAIAEDDSQRSAALLTQFVTEHGVRFILVDRMLVPKGLLGVIGSVGNMVFNSSHWLIYDIRPEAG